MIDALTSTIARIDHLVVHVHAIRFPPIDQYRSSAMRLMRVLSDDEIRDDFAEVRRFLWMRVAHVVRTPCEWSTTWQSEATETLGHLLAGNKWGDIVTNAADEFVRATKLLSDVGCNPLRRNFLSLLDGVSANEKVAVVLPSQPELATVFLEITHPTFHRDRFLSENYLRRTTEPFDYLIMLGRFDDRTPHHILSAPKWKQVRNLRWSGDNDDEDTLPLMPAFSPEDQACGWLAREHTSEAVEYVPAPDVVGVTGNALQWSAPGFEDMFRPGRRDRNITISPLYSGYAVWVALSDGGGTYVGFDENGRSRPVWVLDEEDGSRVMYCVPSISDPPDPRLSLEEGLVVMVPLAPQQPVGVQESVDLTRRLRWWKAKLASKVAKHTTAEVARDLRAHGLAYQALENAISRWKNADAPQEEEVFKILIHDYLGMKHPDPNEESVSPWWQMAWNDVVDLRHMNQAAGQHRRWLQDAMSDDAVRTHKARIIEELETLGRSRVQVDAEYTLVCARVHHVCRGVDGGGYRVAADACGYYVPPPSAAECQEPRGNHG